MAGRVGDGSGHTGRFAEIVEEPEAGASKSKARADRPSEASSTNRDMTSIESPALRGVVERWRAKGHSKSKTDGILKPPRMDKTGQSGLGSEVVIREKKPENLARIEYEIIRRPDDLSAEQLTFDVRVNGRDYELAVRGPVTEAQLQEIAANSASTCVVLQRSGVRSFEKATLESTGDVKVEQPRLGERGPVAEQVRKTLAAAKVEASLSALSFEVGGGVAFQVRGRDDAFEIPERFMRETPFQVEGGELSNLAEALTTYAKLACPELVEPESLDKHPPTSTTTGSNVGAFGDGSDSGTTRVPTLGPTDVPGGARQDRPSAAAGDDPPSVAIRPLGPFSETDHEPRKIDDVFDYADKPIKKKEKLPGILGGILRGTKYKPVFGTDGNWLKKGIGTAGNWILKELGKEGSKLVHKTFSGEKKIPLNEDLTLGFTVSGRKIREDAIKAGDPRKVAIEKLREKYPSSLPIWVEGQLGQNLAFDFGHSIPIGATGLAANFGFKADESLKMTMQRLVYFQPGMEAITDADDQLKRLMLTPMKAKSATKLEDGAHFKLEGKANLRLDASLGLGVSVPALSNLVSVGAGVEAGGFATLSGGFKMDVQHRGEGRMRVKLGSSGTGGGGVKLRAYAGAEFSEEQLTMILRQFGGFIASGGDPEEFSKTLSNAEERDMCSSMSGYMNLMVKNLAEGGGRPIADSIIKKYGSAAFEARKGMDLKSNFDTSIDFDLTSKETVKLPRADMVPDTMRKGRGPGQPLSVEVGQVASLAYEMALRGDLRLVQQLSLIRGSGVRVNERKTVKSTQHIDAIELNLPFVEFAKRHTTKTRTIDRFTAELGRTRTAIESFTREYKGLFGDYEKDMAEVRVHTPDGKKNAEVFFGSDENVSADLVVLNRTEQWTNYSEMQDLVGVLNALSGDRLHERAKDALRQGQFHDGYDDEAGMNAIERLFKREREFGKTIAHLHVWIGEAGLRELLAADVHEDELYQEIGRVFANIRAGGKRKSLPEWAFEGADRSPDRDGRRVGLTGSNQEQFRIHEDEEGLEMARYVVENIIKLRQGMIEATTPAAEEKVAADIRDFLDDAKSHLKAYAALAMLVSEDQRAVEMRLTSLRKEEVPIRFTYIQDGRASDLLYATGFARAAMNQYKRYNSVLDAETRLRIGNLLGEVNGVLNSPSPDTFLLDRAMRELKGELERLDTAGEQMADKIEHDIGLARAFLDGVPDVETIQAVLPGPKGTGLATLRMNAQRLVNQKNPDLVLLRETFKNLLANREMFAEIEAAAPKIESLALLANELVKNEPESGSALAALEAVNSFRQAMQADDVDMKEVRSSLASISRAHVELMGEAEELVESGEIAAVGARVDESDRPSEPTALVDRDFAGAREKEAQRFENLVGHPATACVSYFERIGAVPKTFIGTPNESLGEGVITGSMLREAELKIAASKVTSAKGVPALPQAKADTVAAQALSGDIEGFFKSIEDLRFYRGQSFTDPKRIVVDAFLRSLSPKQRGTILEKVSTSRQKQLKKIFGEIDRDIKSGKDRSSDQDLLKLAPRYKEDLYYFKKTLTSDAKNLDVALGSLGYDATLKGWMGATVTRLDAVFSQLDGDQVDKLVGQMTNKQRERFLDSIRSSDLSPHTRAKIAGRIVDNTFFWEREEELVAALVTDMTAADARLFFDQLHADGKLEQFLGAGSWWQTMLEIFTLGLSRFLGFTHNNEKARQIVAKIGWSTSELQAAYDANVPMASSIEKQAESILLNAALDTAPMDPLVKTGVRAVYSITGNVRYTAFKDFPKDAKKMLEKTAEGAGLALLNRLVYIAKNGGSKDEIVADYKTFFEGLSPSSIKSQFETGDSDGPAIVLSRELRKGALDKLKKEAKGGKHDFLTPELVQFLDEVSDNPVLHEPPAED